MELAKVNDRVTRLTLFGHGQPHIRSDLPIRGGMYEAPESRAGAAGGADRDVGRAVWWWWQRLEGQWWQQGPWLGEQGLQGSRVQRGPGRIEGRAEGGVDGRRPTQGAAER